MGHWSKRLRLWMQAAGLKVPDLARISGVSEESLYKYLRGRTEAPRGDVLQKIAHALGKSAVELRYGIDVAHTQQQKSVPLLNIGNIGPMSDLGLMLEHWGGARVLVPAYDDQRSAFAVEINDDACAPKIEGGDIVVVDLDLARLPGDFVLAYVTALKVSVCRRYRPRHAAREDVFDLVALNTDFPTIHVSGPSDGHLIGRVVRVVKTL